MTSLQPSNLAGEGWTTLKQRLDGDANANRAEKRTSETNTLDLDDSYAISGDTMIRHVLAEEGWDFGIGMKALQSQALVDERTEPPSDSRGNTNVLTERSQPLRNHDDAIDGSVVDMNRCPPPSQDGLPTVDRPSKPFLDMGKSSYDPSCQDAGTHTTTFSAQSSRQPGLEAIGQQDSPIIANGSEGTRLEREGSVARTNAIAKLKRAASQREIRNRSPGPRLAFAAASPGNGDGTNFSTEPATPAASDTLDARYVITPGGDSSFLSHLDSGSASPMHGRSNSRGGDYSGAGNGLLGANLSRSGSRLGGAGGGNKSPLPSLEQLRARILQERTTAGLARSASTSAASAAARQYAMEKLLGNSFREGAVSPVSDTAEEQEEENKRRSVVKMERPNLRRSRTIGGLSASAEAQRKAAFAEAIDQGLPGEGPSTRRNSRRFAHAPPGTDFAKESEVHPLPASSSLLQPDPSVERNTSQRQVARTEMLRKLSTRRGAASPASALNNSSVVAETQADEPQSKSTDVFGGITQIPSNSSQINETRGAVLLQRLKTGIERSPRPGLLGVPLANNLAWSPSIRSSGGFQHEDELSRASEMARLNGEEAFEYERLLEMGLSMDDAWDRIASARKSMAESSSSHRSNSYLKQSQSGHGLDGSMLTHLGGSALSRGEGEALETLQDSRVDRGAPSTPLPTEPSGIPSLSGKEDRCLPHHLSEASILLGLDSSVAQLGNDRHSGNDEGRSFPPSSALYAQTSPYPESILASPTNSMMQEKHDSASTQRFDGTKLVANKPTFIDMGNTPSRIRIEDLLTPGFLAEIGNPLDYSHSPVRTPQPQEEVSRRGSRDVTFGEQSAPTSSAAPQSIDPMDQIVQMDDGPGLFRRRTERSVRDAAVMNSSAAQVEAAAKDSARHEDLTPASSILFRSASASPVQPQAVVTAPSTSLHQNNEIKTTSQPTEDRRSTEPAPVNFIDSKDAPKAQTQQQDRAMEATATAAPSNLRGAEANMYAVNAKLAPFPALLAEHAPNPMPTFNGQPTKNTNGASHLPLGEQRHAPVMRSDSVSNKEKFFTTLRRKASRSVSRNASTSKASSPVLDQGVEQSRPMSPTQKLQSFLTRKPSSREGLRSASGNQAPSHWRSLSASKIRPSQPVPMGDIFHITAPDTAQRPLTAKDSHSRNASISSVATAAGPDDATTTLDAGQAHHPTHLQPSTVGLVPSAAAAFKRYSHILTSPAHPDLIEPAGIPGLSPEQIANPPRDYIMSSPVLQVVHPSSIKDRFAFLFSDLIVVAKPLHPPAGKVQGNSPEDLPTLAWTFAVKSVIKLDSLRLTVPKNEQRHSRHHTPLLRGFVQEFAQNPPVAIERVVGTSGLSHTPATIAQLLQQTPGLDRKQVSDYLFETDRSGAVVASYVEMEKLSGVSIESALRSLLLELRFPKRREPMQNMLTLFAKKWTETNKSLIKESFSTQLAIDLVLAIMCLNDALHSARGNAPGYFSLSNERLSKEEFVASFRTMDRESVLSDRTLLRIYGSIRTDALQQALLPSQIEEQLSVGVAAPGVPARITYGIASKPIRISITEPDPDFAIRLYGDGLTFQPQILSFEDSATQEFRIISKELGQHSVSFVRAGRNARRYRSTLSTLGVSELPLPRSTTITVQRAYMQHCFTLTLPTEIRFLFSVASHEHQRQWIKAVKDLSALRRQAIAANPSLASDSAHALSLHVLQEALIQADAKSPLPQRNVSNGSARNGNQMQGANPSHGGISASRRQGSISKHYYAHDRLGHQERDLINPQQGATAASPEIDASSTAGDKVFTGEQLILSVRQNSLLPLVIAHAQRSGI